MVSILGHLWFGGFIINDVRFLSQSQIQLQGEEDSFASFGSYGAVRIGFNLLYILFELVLTYIPRVMTVVVS